MTDVTPMDTGDKSAAGSQRLFQKGAGNYVLLSRGGEAVAFRMVDGDEIVVVDRQSQIDFKATGCALKDEGWKCVGPGMQFQWLLGADE